MFAAAPSSFAALLGGASFLQRASYAVEDVVELFVALHFAVSKLKLAVGQRAIDVDLERSLFFALILAALDGDFTTEFAVETVAERRGQLRVTSADSTFYFNEQLRRRQSCVT